MAGLMPQAMQVGDLQGQRLVVLWLVEGGEREGGHLAWASLHRIEERTARGTNQWAANRCTHTQGTVQLQSCVEQWDHECSGAEPSRAWQGKAKCSSLCAQLDGMEPSNSAVHHQQAAGHGLPYPGQQLDCLQRLQDSSSRCSSGKESQWQGEAVVWRLSRACACV